MCVCICVCLISSIGLSNVTLFGQRLLLSRGLLTSRGDEIMKGKVMQEVVLQFFSDAQMKLLFTEGPIAYFSLCFLFDLPSAQCADQRSSLATAVEHASHVSHL